MLKHAKAVGKMRRTKFHSRRWTKFISPHAALRRLAAALRFKSLVWAVINNLSWLADTSDRKYGQTNLKNINILLHPEDEKVLTLEDKVVLRQPTQLRDDEDLIRISRRLEKFESFRENPEDVRIRMLRMCSFYGYRKGSVLVKKGRIATGVYVLVDGTCKADWTPTEEYASRADYVPGAVFGIDAVVYDEPREETIVARSTIEVLFLEAASFAEISGNFLRKKWAEIRAEMADLPYFQGWYERDLRKVCAFSSIVNYEKNSIIRGTDKSGIDLAHFILTGCCTVVQTVIVDVVETRNGTKYKLSADQSVSPQALKGRKDKECMLFGTLQLIRKCCFGIGENLSMYTIVCNRDARCLVMPSESVCKFNYFEIWPRVKNYLNNNYPDIVTVFNKFEEQRRWEQHRRELCRKWTKRQFGTVPTVHYVPFHCRNDNLLNADVKERLMNTKEYKLFEKKILKESNKREEKTILRGLNKDSDNDEKVPNFSFDEFQSLEQVDKILY